MSIPIPEVLALTSRSRFVALLHDLHRRVRLTNAATGEVTRIGPHTHCLRLSGAGATPEQSSRPLAPRPRSKFASLRHQPKTTDEFPHHLNQCGSGGGLRSNHRHTFNPMRDHLPSKAIHRHHVACGRTSSCVFVGLSGQRILTQPRFRTFVADELEGRRLGN